MMTSNNFDSPDGERSDVVVARPEAAAVAAGVVPAWATLAALCASLSRATRRWTDAALNEALAPAETRAAILMHAAGLPCAKTSVALNQIRPGLAADVATVTRADGSWELRRREALSRGGAAAGSPRKSLGLNPAADLNLRTNLQTPSDNTDASSIDRNPCSDAVLDDDPCSATTAYLAVSGSLDDASAALLACQLALHQALDSARAAVYADALDLELGRDAAAAAAAARASRPSRATRRRSLSGTSRASAPPGWRGSRTRRAAVGRETRNGAFKSPLPALLAEARGAQADRAPCPAAALEMLRGGDAAVAVNAVADAAAEAAGAFARMGLGGAAGGGVRERSCEVGRGAAELLRAAAALLNGGGGGGGRGRREAVPVGYVLAPLRASQALQAEVRSRRRRRGRVAVDRGGGARTDVDRRQLVALERALFNAG